MLYCIGIVFKLLLLEEVELLETPELLFLMLCALIVFGEVELLLNK